MAYIVPQVLVSVEFEEANTASERDLHAHITAPHAYLLRYSDEDEKVDGFLGYYNDTAETCYSWPERPAGAEVDTDYTKVYIDNALLRYFEDHIGSGSTITTVAGYSNRIRSATLGFIENGDDYARSDEFYDRDVTVGDIAKVRYVLDDESVTLWTYVRGFDYETVAATIATASSDDDNADTQSASSSFEKTAGADNCVDIDTVSHTSYTGLADGDITETYTVEVTESSIDGDLTTARLRITSASGNDDIDDVTPAAADSPTDIGTRGLTATFTISDELSCSSDAEDDGVAQDDFIVGQKWEITVNQAFTKPTATSAGTYTGDYDTTYIIEVTRGGLYADTDDPQITVSTTTGVDVSGPTDITATATAVAVGTEGVTVAFNQTGLRKGDKYYIDVTAAADGRASTLILGHNLDSDLSAGSEVDLTLYIKKNIEVTENRVGFAPITNWTQSSTELCVADGVVAYDSTWTDDGEELPLDVVSAEAKSYGKLYVEYRAWRTDLANEVGSVGDVANLDDAISGALHPDNPLKWAVFKALSNSNGVDVKFTAVEDPDDEDSWLEVLELIDGRIDVYGLVPCTTNQTVLEAWKAHVLAQSTPEYGRWRVMWTALENASTVVVLDATLSTDEEEVLATVTDDTGTSGTQYTRLRVPAGNADFETIGVRAGDVVRLLYTTDGFGEYTYTEAIVDTVTNEDELLLLSGLDAAINVAAKIEIWRNLTATEQAAELATQAGAWACRRVMAVWPDEISSGGTTMAGYHLCAALAGMASGVVPHQGLTRLEISGFDDVSRTTGLFNRTQLNTMAESGVWIVTQDENTGTVYTRHAVTTGDTDSLNEREEMVTRNTDSISYLFGERLDPYIGISNVTPSMLAIIESEVLAIIQLLRNNNFVARLGGQLIDGTITEIRAHAVFQDRIVVALDLEIPYALNVIDVRLVV